MIGRAGAAAPPMNARELPRLGAAVLLALALPAAIALAFDDRTLLGVTVWSKPLKFDLSLGLHLITLYVLLGLLPAAQLEKSWVRAVVMSGVLCCVLEALYITLQAARGRPSHFNLDTPLEAVLYYGAMGSGAAIIVASSFVVGWLLWPAGDGAGPAAGLRRGAALGLMAGSAATLAVAAVLSAGVLDGPGHWVGGSRSDATGLALFGWSTSGGDLRVPHFFATHLIQALPITGWMADRLDPARARAWVAVACACGLAVVAATFWQAASGQPFIRI